MMMKITALIALSLAILSPAYANEKWVQKPVQCGSPDKANQILSEYGEKAILGGLTNVKGPEDNRDFYYPLYFFANTETGSFTIIEYHLGSNEVCVIGYGNGLDFDVQKFFEPKKES